MPMYGPMTDVSTALGDGVERAVGAGRVTVTDVGSMLADGFDRLTDGVGVRFVALFALVGVVLSALVAYDLTASSTPTVAGLPLVGIGYVVGVLALLVLAVAAIRTFATDETEQIPPGFLSRRLVWVLTNLAVGLTVFTILVAAAIVFGLVFFKIFTVFLGGMVLSALELAGLAVLVVSVAFLLVTFFFWWVVVVVEDRDFVESVGVSWRLTEGHRLQLFGLAVVLSVAMGAIALLGNVVALVASAAVGFGLAVLLGGVFAAYYSATVAGVYRDLRGDGSIPGV